MAKLHLQGVIAPSITPFRPDGEVDDAALGPYLDFLAGHVPVICVGAIYGSGILMRPDQRQRVAEQAVQVARGRAQVVVFVGAADTDTAVSLARHAQAVGANAVTAVTPFYYRQVDEALFRHFKAIVDAVEIPALIYDSPTFSGNPLSLDVLRRLADAGVAGMLTGHAGYGLEYLWERYRHLAGEHFTVLSIRDGLALPALMLGSPAFESGVANFLPELPTQLYHAVLAGQHDLATRLQDQMLQIRDISHLLGRNIPTLHALIEMRGLQTGHPKRPFFRLSEAEVADLRGRLEQLGFAEALVG